MNPYQNLKRVEKNLTTKEAIMKLNPLGDKIILVDLEHGETKTKAGIIILDDSNTAAGERGIKARWARVYAVGPDQKDVKPGDRVLMDHGRWSLGQDIDLGEGPFRFWLGDPNGILGIETAD